MEGFLVPKKVISPFLLFSFFQGKKKKEEEEEEKKKGAQVYKIVFLQPHGSYTAAHTTTNDKRTSMCARGCSAARHARPTTTTADGG